jgi:hypothetical protein
MDIDRIEELKRRVEETKGQDREAAEELYTMATRYGIVEELSRENRAVGWVHIEKTLDQGALQGFAPVVQVRFEGDSPLRHRAIDLDLAIEFANKGELDEASIKLVRETQQEFENPSYQTHEVDRELAEEFFREALEDGGPWDAIVYPLLAWKGSMQLDTLALHIAQEIVAPGAVEEDLNPLDAGTTFGSGTALEPDPELQGVVVGRVNSNVIALRLPIDPDPEEEEEDPEEVEKRRQAERLEARRQLRLALDKVEEIHQDIEAALIEMVQAGQIRQMETPEPGSVDPSEPTPETPFEDRFFAVPGALNYDMLVSFMNLPLPAPLAKWLRLCFENWFSRCIVCGETGGPWEQTRRGNFIHCREHPPARDDLIGDLTRALRLLEEHSLEKP